MLSMIAYILLAVVLLTVFFTGWAVVFFLTADLFCEARGNIAKALGFGTYMACMSAYPALWIIGIMLLCKHYLI